MIQLHYDDVVTNTFLKNQLQLFPEPVADTPEEADDFLDMMMAMVFDNLKEVRACLEDLGVDLHGTAKDLSDVAEVFPLPDGRYLVVEG